MCSVVYILLSTMMAESLFTLAEIENVHKRTVAFCEILLFVYMLAMAYAGVLM